MSHKYEVYNVGNFVNKYAISLYGDMLTRLNLSCWNVQKYSITVLCTRELYNVVTQLHFTKKQKQTIS